MDIHTHQGWIFFRVPRSTEFRLFWPFRFRIPSADFVLPFLKIENYHPW